MRGVPGALKRLAARRVATGCEVALPVFDGSAATGWRVRDTGTLGLVAARARLRLGAWGHADRLVVIVGPDADVAAAILAAHPEAHAVPSFDLFGLLRGRLSVGAIAALVRLYAGAFRDTGGRWGGVRADGIGQGGEDRVRCLAVAWPHERPRDAADLLENLRGRIAPRKLCVVRTDAETEGADVTLPSGGLAHGNPDALSRLFGIAGLSVEALSPDALPIRQIGTDRVHVLSCLSVGHDLPLLPHFLDHYTGLGVDPSRIHVILNAPDETAPGLDAARAVLRGAGAPADHVWIGSYASAAMWARRRDLQRAVTGPGDWVISADADEFHVYPGGLSAVLGALRAHGADWLQGPMIDRVGPGGALAPVVADRPIWEQFPVEGDLMCQISRRPEARDGGGTVKAMLVASHLLPGLGGHGLSLEESAARAGDMAASLDADPEAPRTPLERSLARALAWDPAPLMGSQIAGHPRIIDPVFRLSFPAYVAHFKWRDVLVAELSRRRASGLQTEAAARYAETLQDFLRDRGTIDLSRMVRRRAWHRPVGFAAHLARLRAEAVATGAPGVTRPDRHAWHLPQVRAGWRVRQLTFGSAGGTGHFHSYYDIPVLNGAETRVAAVRHDTPHRPLAPDDQVTVGTVPLAGGPFVAIARTAAWSWQQGPMLQWLPGRDRLVWNDREGGRFVARLADADGGDARTLDRPVYALDPNGGHALSLDFARLDAMRPGYGYAGGNAGAMESVSAEDGIWRMDLETGAARLILSLARAVEVLHHSLGNEDRAHHDASGFTYWFNHCKIAPGGARFTTKLRWRKPGGGWNGTMGVSLTCGMDGADPRVIARAASHVIWLDNARLYFWNQGKGQVMLIGDRAMTDPPEARIFDPAIFDANVHLRHVPDDPARMVFDTPYAEIVQLRLYDRDTGGVEDIAQFGGHIPARGEYRCDLHPVPTRDGHRIVVTSPADGMRQIYLAERT